MLQEQRLQRWQGTQELWNLQKTRAGLLEVAITSAAIKNTRQAAAPKIPESRQLSIRGLEPCRLVPQALTVAVQLHLAPVKAVQHQGVSRTGGRPGIADQVPDGLKEEPLQVVSCR